MALQPAFTDSIQISVFAAGQISDMLVQIKENLSLKEAAIASPPPTPSSGRLGMRKLSRTFSNASGAAAGGPLWQAAIDDLGKAAGNRLLPLIKVKLPFAFSSFTFLQHTLSTHSHVFTPQFRVSPCQILCFTHGTGDLSELLTSHLLDIDSAPTQTQPRLIGDGAGSNPPKWADHKGN